MCAECEKKDRELASLREQVKEAQYETECAARNWGDEHDFWKRRCDRKEAELTALRAVAEAAEKCCVAPEWSGNIHLGNWRELHEFLAAWRSVKERP